MSAPPNEFADLVGLTLASIDGAVEGSAEVVFVAETGESGKLYHQRDCCESVALVDVCGDIVDLIGSPLVTAEEVSNADDPADRDVGDYSDDSHTWTFYRLATARGLVVLRWLGESNGYYSESVAWDGLTGRRREPPMAPIVRVGRRAIVNDDEEGG